MMGDYQEYAKAWLDSHQQRPDHVEAAIEMLQDVVDRLRAGVSPEDLGLQVIRLGRLMARRT